MYENERVSFHFIQALHDYEQGYSSFLSAQTMIVTFVFIILFIGISWFFRSLILHRPHGLRNAVLSPSLFVATAFVIGVQWALINSARGYQEKRESFLFVDLSQPSHGVPASKHSPKPSFATLAILNDFPDSVSNNVNGILHVYVRAYDGEDPNSLHGVKLRDTPFSPCIRMVRMTKEDIAPSFLEKTVGSNYTYEYTPTEAGRCAVRESFIVSYAGGNQPTKDISLLVNITNANGNSEESPNIFDNLRQAISSVMDENAPFTPKSFTPKMQTIFGRLSYLLSIIFGPLSPAMDDRLKNLPRSIQMYGKAKQREV